MEVKNAKEMLEAFLKDVELIQKLAEKQQKIIEPILSGDQPYIVSETSVEILSAINSLAKAREGLGFDIIYREKEGK